MKKQLLLFMVLIFSVNSITAMQNLCEKAYWALRVSTEYWPEEYVYEQVAQAFEHNLLFCAVQNNRLFLICLNEKLSERRIKKLLKGEDWFDRDRLGKESELQLMARSKSHGPYRFIITPNGPRDMALSKSKSAPKESQSLIFKTETPCKESRSLILRK